MEQNNKITFEQFGHSFQEKLVASLIKEKEFADRMMEVLNPQYLARDYLKEIVSIVFDYHGKYKSYPSLETLSTILKTTEGGGEERLFSITFVDNVRQGKVSLEDIDFVKTQSLDFCRKQKLNEAMLRSIKLLKNCSFEEIKKVIDDAVKLGAERDFGTDYHDDFEMRYTSGEARKTIPTGWEHIDRITQGGLGRKEIGVVMAPTGCHAKGTSILMFDGKLKNVENVKVGDRLMGPDSQPREVLRLIQGREQMYKITPHRGGEPFIVNENHILSLKRTNDGVKSKQFIEISVKDYLLKSKTFKHVYKLHRAGVEFAETDKKLPIAPYMLGLILGDGHLATSRHVGITSCDKEIKDYVVNYVQQRENKLTLKSYSKKTNENIFDMRICRNQKKQKWKREPSFLFKRIMTLGLERTRSGNKFVPDVYKTSSRKNRLEMLAGLIDTDSHLSKGGCFEFCSKSKQLADDFDFLARSLGFTSSQRSKIVNKTTYYVCVLSGDLSLIPTKIARKKGDIRRQKKNHLVSGFTVEEVGVDDFYGFTIDKDHLYLTGDFTVHHNCGKSFTLTNMASHAIKQGFNVMFFSLELSENIIHKRVDSRLTEIEIDELDNNKDKVREVEKAIPGTLKVKWFPKKSASVDRLRMFLDKMKETSGFVPDVIMVDYADIMKPAFNNPEKRHGIEGIYEDLEAMAQELDCALWTCSQTNRGGTQKEFVELDSTSEAFAKCFGAYLILTLQRSPEDKVANTGKMFVAKNRNGPDGLLFSCFIDTGKGRIDVLRQIIKNDGGITNPSGSGTPFNGDEKSLEVLLGQNKINLGSFLGGNKMKKVAE